MRSCIFMQSSSRVTTENFAAGSECCIDESAAAFLPEYGRSESGLRSVPSHAVPCLGCRAGSSRSLSRENHTH